MAGRNPKYTKKDVENFLSLIKGGMQKKVAAESLGTDAKTIGQAAQRLGIEIPKRTPAIDLVRPYEQQILVGEITQWQIARATGLSQCCVSKLYKQEGWPALPVGGHGREKTLPLSERISQADELIEYLTENGGYVLPLIRELGLGISKCFFYAYCKEVDFEYEKYRWANRHYGYWRTLPCTPPRKGKSDYLVTAECTLCKSVHQVSLVNMKVGSSTMCRSCAAKRKEFTSVKCLETGVRYRSVMDAARKIGTGYQGFRKKLIKDGKAEVAGKTYVTIRKVYTSDLTANHPQTHEEAIKR